MALDFAGAASDRVSVTDHASLNVGSDYALWAWVYPTGNSSALVDRVYDRLNHGYLAYTNGGGPTTVNGLRVQITRATTNAVAQSVANALVPNKWQFVAVRYSESNGPQIYVGDLTTPVAEVSYTAAPTVGAGATTEGTVLYIGNRDLDGSNFPGYIAVFGRSPDYLTVAQLEALRLGDIHAPTAHTLGIYMHLGLAGTGTQSDLSGNANNGTVTGTALAPHVPLLVFRQALSEFEAAPTTVNGNFTADAIIQRTVAGSLTADAVVQRTAAASFAADAILKKTAAASFTAAAIVQRTEAGSFAADAILLATGAASFTADAILQKTTAGTYTADAIVRKAAPGSFTADAWIEVAGSVAGSFTADAIVQKTAAASFTAGAIVRRTEGGAYTADAIVRRTAAAALTADAIVRRVAAGSLTADAIVGKTAAASFTADAYILVVGQVLGSFTADAVIGPRVPPLATFKALGRDFSLAARRRDYSLSAMGRDFSLAARRRDYSLSAMGRDFTLTGVQIMGDQFGVKEGDQGQLVGEEIVRDLNVSLLGTGGTTPTVQVLDLTAGGTDVTATSMPGGASIVNDIVTLPALKSLTAGHRYEVRVQVNFSGNKPIVRYYVDAEA